MRASRSVLLLTTLVVGHAQAQQGREPADLILHHGKVVTLDDRNRTASAVVIRAGTIVAVGEEQLLERYAAARTIDVGGRLVLPGFNDAHTHLSGDARRYIDLSSARSIRELQDKVRAKAVQLGPGEWITGYGWAEDNFVEQRLPMRTDLDAAAPGNPVILARAGDHSSVANSLALRLAGITRDTPHPSAGMIEHDSTGEPTGIIRERADIVNRLVPVASPDELRPSFVQSLRDQLSFGITSLVMADETVRNWPEWERVYREHPGQLPRAAVQIRWNGESELRAFGKRSGDGDEWLRVGALKVYVDGGFTGPSAYTLQPYKGMPGFRGTLNRTPDELYQIAKTAHAMGWQMGFHTIGDGAIALTVDVFDRVLRESPRPDHRHYVNHFSMLPPDATLATMARDSILVAQQPNFTYTLEQRYAQTLDGTRLAHNNPVATPMNRGIVMAFSSDILPIGPMVGLYAAVTRKGKSGVVYGADERVSMLQALRAYTRGAYLTHEEHRKGTIEAGKLADLIVLSADLTTIPPEQILGTTVDMTVLGGRVVYERATPYVNPHARDTIGTVRQMYDGSLTPERAVSTFRNIDRLFPTRVITRGSAPYPLLPAATPLSSVAFTSKGTGYALDDYLRLNRVSGLLVLKNGRVALERYAYGNNARTRWMSMSIAKSITSTLIGAAIKDGAIGSIDDPVTKYVPRLAGGAYDGVTVRNVLMMASGVRWNETYTDPGSDRRRLLDVQIAQQPGGAIELMRTLTRAAAPGSVYNYSTGETQVAGEVLCGAVGMSLAQYLSEKIWGPFGMETDASWWLDAPDGHEISGSGLSATLRDYGRFGLFVLGGGVINGLHVLPDGWATTAGARKTLPNGSRVDYGYMWWPTSAAPNSVSDGAFSAVGIFGQAIYINPREQVVIVQWSAHTKPLGGEIVDPDDFFGAVSLALR